MSYGLKYKRPTRKEEGHTNIIVDGKIIGYFMPERSPFRAVNNNWWLHSSQLGYFSFSSRKKLIEYLDMRIGKD